MKPEATEYTPPKHVRWRVIGESVTSHYMNTQRKDVFIDPCECIKKLFDAAKAAVDNPPANDRLGSKQVVAISTLRGVRDFHAHFKAYEYAKTATEIYDNTVPGKWRVATEAQIKECGLKSEADLVIENRGKGGETTLSPFKVHIAAPENLEFCEPMPATLVFKGTTFSELEDWLNNLQQGMDMHSDYYRQAVRLGVRLKDARRPMAISGHSLGGGLAAACAHTCGKDAWTFNAAGLHPNTVERYSLKKPVPAKIEAYRHEGEVLTGLQEPGWRGRFAQVSLPTVAGVWLAGPLGLVVGGWLAKKLVQMPTAPGSKHELPCMNDEWSGMERHGMSETLRSFNQMLREMEDKLRKQTGVQCEQPVVV